MFKIIFCILLLIALIFLFKYLFRKKIKNYDHKFWSIIEAFWLFTTFIGVSIGLYDFERVGNQFDYQNKEANIAGEYHDLKNVIDGQLLTLLVDSNTSHFRKESINWFYTAKSLLDDGYKSMKWRGFLYYTRAYVFEEKGYINLNQEKALLYHWPTDLQLNAKKLELRNEIKMVTDKLINLEESLLQYEKIEPDKEPLYFTRYAFIILLTTALSLKILKVYADYARSSLK